MLSLVSLLVSAQEKIGNKMYLYGDLNGAVAGKTLVHYGINDPKGAVKALKEFSNKGFDVISWDKLFMPGRKYSKQEMAKKVNDYGIESIIFIKFNGKSTYTQSNANSTYSSFTNSINTSGSSYSVVGRVGLLFEFYTKKTNFDKPIAVINCNATNSWGAAGSQRGVALKIVRRVVSELKSHIGDKNSAIENNENQTNDIISTSTMNSSAEKLSSQYYELINKSVEYASNGDFVKFKYSLIEALKYNPTEPTIYYNIGVACMQQNRIDEAINYFNKAIELKPDYGDAYNNIGAAIIEKTNPIIEEMNKSLSDFEKYDRLQAQQFEIYKEAVPFYEKAYELNSTNISVIQTLMGLYENLKMVKEHNSLKLKYDKIQ